MCFMCVVVKVYKCVIEVFKSCTVSVYLVNYKLNSLFITQLQPYRQHMQLLPRLKQHSTMTFVNNNISVSRSSCCKT